MWIFDGHLDLAMNALDWGRDLAVPVAQTRAIEQQEGRDRKGSGRGTVAYPDMHRGAIGVSIATVIARASRPGNPLPGYRTAEAAHAAARGQLAYYRAREARGVLRILQDWPTLAAHIAEFERDPGGTPLGIILTMEGADPVLSPEDLQAWYELGLRCIGLAHYGVSNYAHGTSTPGGLTDLGKALLPAVQTLGLILDLTHLADQAFWEAMERFDGVVHCSHQCCRALVPGDRQMTDEQLRAVIARKGVIGVALDAWMLYPGWEKEVTQPDVVGLEAVADQIDRICQLAGNSLHAGIGSDLDGGFGTEQTPRDLDTIADLQKIPAILRARGYRESDVENVMNANFVRLFRRAWV